jgi:hypothetical protein
VEWRHQPAARPSCFTLHDTPRLLTLTTAVFHCLLWAVSRAVFDAEWRHQTSLLRGPAASHSAHMKPPPAVIACLLKQGHV